MNVMFCCSVLSSPASKPSRLSVRAWPAVAAGLLLGTCVCECRAAPEEPKGAVLHFNLDEVRFGGLIANQADSNRTGRASNVKTVTPGKLGAACEFAAKSSYIQVPDCQALNPKQVTLALWFKTGKEAWAPRTLLEKGTEHGYALSLVGGGKENARKGKIRATVNGRDVFSDSLVTDDLWHHAAATYDGETLKLYVDGVLQKQTLALHGELAPNSHDLTLGMNRSNSSAHDKEVSLDGAMDEVLVFNRALTEAEIKELIASVKPKFTKYQVERRLKELKELLDRGLILQDFYDRKVKECEVVE